MDFGSTLSEHLQGDAVGVELEDWSVSLSETDIQVDPTPADLDKATTGVTPASFAIADYGSVVVPSKPAGAELVSLYVDRHVAIVHEQDILPGMNAAFGRFEDEIQSQGDGGIIATGPSVTADMGALVHGVHGPSEVHVIVVEESDE